MSYTFATYQIAELARDAEEQSQTFYKYLARFSDNGMVKSLFELLSEQEGEHRLAFDNLAKKYRDKGDLFEYSIDLYSIIKRDTDRLKDISFALHATSRISSVREAVEVSIKVERDSARAYKEIREVLTDDFRAILDAIIKTEENHLKLVLDLQKTLIETNLI